MTASGPEAPPRALADTAAALESIFDEASATTGVVEHHCTIAGHGLRLRFAGPALVDHVMGALRHLPAETGPDELTVCIWDTASTATRLPDSPLIPRVDELTHSPLFRNGDLSFLLQHGDNALSVLDAERALAFYCLPNAEPSVHHRGAPLRVLLSWWLNGLGCQLVHSAAVGRHGRAVLVTGPSGAGKSTTALECARQGWDYIGDDYVVLAPEPPFVHSAYRTAKLDREHRARNPELLRDVLDGQPDEKALGYVAHAHLGLPVQAVVLPRVVGEARSEIRPTTAGRALLALAPATVLQLPGASEAALRAMRGLVASVPVFELRLGADLERVPALLEDLVRS